MSIQSGPDRNPDHYSIHEVTNDPEQIQKALESINNEEANMEIQPEGIKNAKYAKHYIVREVPDEIEILRRRAQEEGVKFVDPEIEVHPEQEDIAYAVKFAANVRWLDAKTSNFLLRGATRWSAVCQVTTKDMDDVSHFTMTAKTPEEAVERLVERVRLLKGE